MKKLIVLLCFFAGATCFISAGLYINKQNAGIIDSSQYNFNEETTVTVSPELLSSVNMSSYVSLPAAFSNVDVVENIADVAVTEDNVEEVMYDKLMSTASHLASIKGDDKMLIIDYTITKDNEVQEVESDYRLGYDNDSKLYDSEVYKQLTGAYVGDTVHIENVMFNHLEGVSVDIIITDILDMPYPVTDNYIANKTEYDSIYNMKTTLINSANGEVKQNARQETLDKLIDIMMEQTTFIKLPDSLIMKELEVLQKEDKNATYDEAKHSLQKIFFLSSVIKEYDIATKTDMEKRYEKLSESEKEGLSEYEIERKKYLLFEDDVITCIYKEIAI